MGEQQKAGGAFSVRARVSLYPQEVDFYMADAY